MYRLKSDYFRIEIRSTSNEYDKTFPLKSDYFRIEMDVDEVVILVPSG